MSGQVLKIFRILTKEGYMSKIMSGRWIFTVIAALVFLYCATTKYMSVVDVKEIVMIVIVFYFQRPDRGQNGTPKQP